MPREPAAPYRLVLEYPPSDEDVQVVQSGLNAHNLAQPGIGGMQSLAAFIRSAGGQIVGGVSGRTWGEVLDIRQVWVHDDVRGMGYGRQLMQLIEAEAVKCGCRVAVLDTYSFQAPEFYRKMGYEAFGVIDGYPSSHRKYFMKKALRSGTT